MITRAKRKQLSGENSATSDQQQATSSDNGEDTIETQRRTKDLEKMNDIGSLVHDVDLHTNLSGTLNKRFKQNTDYGFKSNDTQWISPMFDRLPNEIVSLIIDYLSNDPGSLYVCSLLNKRCHLFANPLLWQAPVFIKNVISKRFINGLSDTSLQRLSMVKNYIRELHLRGTYWSDIEFTQLLQQLHQLKHITIGDSTYITGLSLQQLPHYCQHLTSLHIYSTTMTYTAFLTIGKVCNHLRDFGWSGRFPPYSANLALLSTCPLESLYIASEKPIYGNHMDVIKNFNKLTCLEIKLIHRRRNKHQYFYTPMKYILREPTNNTIISSSNSHPSNAISTLWPKMTKLILEPCSSLDDVVLFEFLQSHPYLQELGLLQSWGLSDNSLDAIAMWIPDLTHLDLTHNDRISSNGVRRLIRKCQHLVYLNLFLCSYLKSNQFPEYPKWRCGTVLDKKAIDKIRQGVME